MTSRKYNLPDAEDLKTALLVAPSVARKSSDGVVLPIHVLVAALEDERSSVSTLLPGHVPSSSLLGAIKDASYNAISQKYWNLRGSTLSEALDLASTLAVQLQEENVTTLHLLMAVQKLSPLPLFSYNTSVLAKFIAGYVPTKRVALRTYTEGYKKGTLEGYEKGYKTGYDKGKIDGFKSPLR